MDAGQTTHFARVDFRNNDRVFGIKDEDRFLHIYVIGKTGTGKSSLIETMARHRQHVSRHLHDRRPRLHD